MLNFMAIEYIRLFTICINTCTFFFAETSTESPFDIEQSKKGESGFL